MNTYTIIIVGCLLLGNVAFGKNQQNQPQQSVKAKASQNLSPADQKWAKVVKQMIAEGATTISTPLKHRAKLAQDIAKELGRDCKVTSAKNNFRIEIKAPKQKNLASNRRAQSGLKN